MADLLPRRVYLLKGDELLALCVLRSRQESHMTLPLSRYKPVVGLGAEEGKVGDFIVESNLVLRDFVVEN